MGREGGRTPHIHKDKQLDAEVIKKNARLELTFCPNEREDSNRTLSVDKVPKHCLHMSSWLMIILKLLL